MVGVVLVVPLLSFCLREGKSPKTDRNKVFVTVISSGPQIHFFPFTLLLWESAGLTDGQSYSCTVFLFSESTYSILHAAAANNKRYHQQRAGETLPVIV